MRCLKRNKRPVYYSKYKEKIELIDEEGFHTGQYKTIYEDPVEILGYVSPASGSAVNEQFGSNLEYDKIIIIDDMNCPIDENTMLFVDKPIEYDKNNEPLFDYMVTRVAKSLNHIAIAIYRVHFYEE